MQVFKQFYFSTGFIGLLIASYITFSSYSLFAPSNKSGSPGDGSDCSSCHSTFPKENIENIIETTIPNAGYSEGENYTITVSGIEAEGFPLYGFSMTAEDAFGQKVGTFTAGINTTVTNNHIGHSPALNSSSPSWTFEWKAPPSGTGKVTFYGAFVQANNKDRNFGDKVKLSNYSVNENTISSTTKIFPSDVDIHLTNEQIWINTIKPVEWKTITAFDLNGRKMMEKSIQTTNKKFSIDVHLLPTGIYFITLFSDKGIVTKQIMK